jgi:hypothetical protein
VWGQSKKILVLFDDNISFGTLWFLALGKGERATQHMAALVGSRPDHPVFGFRELQIYNQQADLTLLEWENMGTIA